MTEKQAIRQAVEFSDKHDGLTVFVVFAPKAGIPVTEAFQPVPAALKQAQYPTASPFYRVQMSLPIPSLQIIPMN